MKSEITLYGCALTVKEMPVLTDSMEQYQMAGTKGYVLVLLDEAVQQFSGGKSGWWWIWETADPWNSKANWNSAQMIYSEAILQEILVLFYGQVIIPAFCPIYLFYFSASLSLFRRVVLRPAKRWRWFPIVCKIIESKLTIALICAILNTYRMYLMISQSRINKITRL